MFQTMQKGRQTNNALPRISNYMSEEKLRVLMKGFVISQFSYLPLVWMFHSRKLNNCIYKIQEKAVRIVYKQKESDFFELLEKSSGDMKRH